MLLPVFTVNVAQAALFTSTVTVVPAPALLAIVTSSPLPGTTPPTHVVVELQFPPAVVEVIAIASTDEANKSSIIVVRRDLKECSCVVIKPVFKIKDV